MIKAGKLIPVISVIKSEIPVTPPSINPFGRRKPFSPRPAESIPKIISAP